MKPPMHSARHLLLTGGLAGVLAAAMTPGAAAAPASAAASESAAAHALPRAASAAVATSAAAATPLLRQVERVEAALRVDPESVGPLSESALAELAQQPDADLELRVRLVRCDYLNERDRAGALQEIERMRALLPRMRQPGLRAGMLACEGELREQAGDNVEAMALYEQAITVATAAGDDERLANALYLRAYLRGVHGDFVQGLLDMRRSLELYERLKLAPQAKTSLAGVAILYNRLGDYTLAQRYFEEALAAETAAGMSRERVITEHNLARVFERQGRWQDAEHHFGRVLAHAREVGYARGQVYALRGLAAVRNALGDAPRALQLLDDAQRLFGHTPDERLRAALLQQRGVALHQLRRYAEAQTLLREAITIFRGGDARADEGQSRDQLARVLADSGEWREAFEQQLQGRQIAESLLRRQLDQRFAAMKVQFDTDVQAKENALLQREKLAGELALAEQQRASRMQILAIVLASALALLLAALVWRQREAGHRMRALAMTDELTGLPNRREALRALQQRLARPDVRGALLIADLDHFKPINDSYGHLVGDEILRAVARVWLPLATEAVVLGRLGGEEFIAVVDPCGPADARALAEAMRESVAQLDVSRWLPDRGITVSIGVTPLTRGESLGAALARADEALYLAKSGGRNRVELV